MQEQPALFGAALERRREDAHALPKLRKTGKRARQLSVLLECDASPHRFSPASPLGRARQVSLHCKEALTTEH
jgi:hypothetical protein